MECGHIPRIDYGKFSAQLHSKAWSGRTLPVNGTLELTQRCNMRCQHCYIPWAGRLGTGTPDGEQLGSVEESGTALARAEVNRPPLSYEEICRLLDDVVEEGCLWLLITGGEPLMRPDFLDIYDYAKRKGLLITLFTNATLMTERITDYLAEFPPFLVEVTLYGATKATYEAVTGVPGSFERCLHGIDLLVERRIPLKLKTMVLKANAHEIAQMEEFAAQRGLAFRWDHMVHPRLDGNRGPTAVRLAPEKMVAEELKNPMRVDGWRDLIVRTRNVRINGRVFSCGAGLGSFHIDAYGYLQLCGFVRRYSYDLRRGPFGSGYREYFPYVRSLRTERPSVCDDCELACVCTVCPAWHDMEGDGPFGQVEHIHKFAQLLAAAVSAEPDARRQVSSVGRG